MRNSISLLIGMSVLCASLAHARESAPLLSCVVSPDYSTQAGISKIDFYPDSHRGLLTMITTDSKGVKFTSTSTVSTVNSGTIAFAQDASNLPFVYQSYLTKTASGWTLQKYWLCDNTYFEETCPTGDATILMETTPVACISQ
ncbi:MAG: hypothetical protein H7222_09315 [Methylotenera sp.]|nr:hypothetical protein [Oligoflexia bacterium]